MGSRVRASFLASNANILLYLRAGWRRSRPARSRVGGRGGEVTSMIGRSIDRSPDHFPVVAPRREVARSRGEILLGRRCGSCNRHRHTGRSDRRGGLRMFPRDVVGFFDRPRTRRLAPVWMAALSVWASGLGCAVPQSSEEPVGSIQIAITNVPGDVSCLQITVSDGLRPVVRKIDVTPMADLTTTQSGLPVGLVSIGVDAFNVTCPAVTAASLPTWVSGTVQATLVGSVPVMLSVNMSRPGSASIGIMF